MPECASPRALGASLAGSLLVLAALAACAEAEKPPRAEPPSAVEADPARSMLVNDAEAANSELEAVPVHGAATAHTLRLPPGVSVSVLASGLDAPRFMAFDEAGNLLVADLGRNAVYRYQGLEGTPKAPAPLLSGLDGPSSLAFHDGYLYVGESRAVTRYRYSPSGAAGKAEPVVRDLPTGGHVTKTVAFGPDGKLYVSMGSSCNICDESDERRAAVLRYNPDGTGYERFARGLRNAVGVAFQPGTGDLWVTCNERDNQGNEIPPDLVTRVKRGDNFGWPRCVPPNGRPQQAGDKCEGITPPTIGIQAHSAPLGLAFATDLKLPSPYNGGLYVAQHGSWNREPPAAPKLLHVNFDAHGAPTGVHVFATGWQDASGHRWGRPVGVLPAPDGSLIVSDDLGGVLYRITGK